MLTLYKSGGANGFFKSIECLDPIERRQLFNAAVQLLTIRNANRAARLLRELPFQMFDATNHFNDEFCILHALLPPTKYEEVRSAAVHGTDAHAYNQIAKVLEELNHGIRFIAVDLDVRAASSPFGETVSLSKREIDMVVYRYIGVNGGYLGDFSYKTHRDFYIDLSLDFDPSEYEGTTRERFIRILSAASPTEQAAILGGILSRYPIGSHESRTEERATEIRRWIGRLRGTATTAAAPENTDAPAAISEFVTPTPRRPMVFICYAKEDRTRAERIYQYLSENHCDPWMDKHGLILGDDFESEIRAAVGRADVFVACLRPGFDAIGFRQKEIHWALDALKLRPPGRGFVVPCLLEPCDLPSWCEPLHAGSDLARPTELEDVLRAVRKHSAATSRPRNYK